MKEIYKIGELSSLSGLGPDSLRYYEELGILTPKRSPKGYRLYSIQEIWKLNVLMELRELDFPMKAIKDYLDHRTVQSTLELLEEENIRLGQKIEELRARQATLRTRLAALQDCLFPEGEERIALRRLNPRKIVRLSESVIRDEEVDFLLFKLKNEQERYLRNLDHYHIGAALPLPLVLQGIYNRYNAVFFLLEEDEEEYDRLLPAGMALSVTCRGNYAKVRAWYPLLLAEAARLHLEPAADPMEIYRIDIHETENPSEYLTDILLPVRKPGP